ncbi:DUF4291 domain-containing protein [Saccharothrix sp. ST-888]|uniref:DUF4291 domain-containing protein n=1 Tax=Saccharothrix sp. ST-888 TaxID=1427391 RepID=UPI0005EC3BE8|nr:DUF4291 domain-containing protein [Saccharothrix sp. ST-888]KJK55672.1 hypothetical protein UK12_27250 [Saccharothrix sp. ST-888]
MTALREIRADYDAHTIALYQAYPPAIAVPAVAADRFVPPFSRGRMTWIKPSFRWLMHRSNWGRKPGQERVLEVRITRAGWERSLAGATLTTADPAALAGAAVHVQWDPERSLSGAALNHYSIQVGIGRAVIDELVDEWTVSVTDLTPRVRKIAELVRSGRTTQAARLLPAERRYPLEPSSARRLGMD